MYENEEFVIAFTELFFMKTSVNFIDSFCYILNQRQDHVLAYIFVNLLTVQEFQG